MMKNIKEKFWDKWMEANELEKIKLVKQLLQVSSIDATLLNSYFIDLLEYFKKKCSTV